MRSGLDKNLGLPKYGPSNKLVTLSVTKLLVILKVGYMSEDGKS
jgi:hypothetical protein